MPSKELILATTCRKQKKVKYALNLPGLASVSEHDKFEIKLTSASN